MTKAAETALVANAAISGLFGTNLPTFLTGKNVAGGFGSNNNNNSWEITAPELLNLIMGGTGGIANNYVYEGKRGLGAAIRKNIRTNGTDALVQMALIPVMFNIGRKVLRKPLLNPTNRALKSIGVSEVKL